MVMVKIVLLLLVRISLQLKLFAPNMVRRQKLGGIQCLFGLGWKQLSVAAKLFHEFQTASAKAGVVFVLVGTN